MSRPNVRRLTVSLILAALLGLAAPVAAGPPSWSLSPAVHGPGLLDQVFSWIAHLWGGDGPRQAPVEKAKDPGQLPAPEADRSSTADPNG